MKEVAHQERKLGRGLSALLGDSKPKNVTVEEIVNQNNQQEKNITIESIAVNKISAGIYQPRRFFNQTELEELADSIKENGLIQPIVLRKSEDGHYEIIAGERRFRAVKILGMTKISAIVRRINNHEALEMAIVENVQRSDLSLIEEAQGYKQLIDDFSYTQEQIAKKTGKSRAHIANILRLLSLPVIVQNMLNQKTISMGHARAIVNAQDPEAMARRINEDTLTVREVEDLIRNEKVENIKNNPLLTRNETRVKFVNSGEMTDLENRLSAILESQVKISYNQFKNSGKVTINFSDIEKIYNLAIKLEE